MRLARLQARDVCGEVLQPLFRFRDARDQGADLLLHDADELGACRFHDLLGAGGHAGFDLGEAFLRLFQTRHRFADPPAHRIHQLGLFAELLEGGIDARGLGSELGKATFGIGKPLSDPLQVGGAGLEGLLGILHSGDHLPARREASLELEGEGPQLPGPFLDECRDVLRDLIAESLQFFERAVVSVERTEDDQDKKDSNKGNQITD